MSYIGSQPADSYLALSKQDFTTSATTTYTLSNSVTSASDIALFINFVRQEPETAYSANSTTLTLTEATSASDDMYCIYLGRTVGTINPPNGSVGTAQLASTAVTPAKMDLSQDYTFTGKISGQNYPAFEVNLGSDQSISSNTNTKVEFDTEIFDTNNYYDNSTNYRFTPQVAGKYFFYTNLRARATSLTQCVVYFYKNGSSYSSSFPYYDASQAQTIFGGYASAVVDLNGSTDYVEVYINIIGTSPLIQWGSTNRQSRFGGYRIGD